MKTKQLLTACLCALLLALMPACAATANEPFDLEPPWGTPAHAYEKCTYDLKVYERVKNDSGVRADGAVLAEGTFSQTLSAAGTGIANRATVQSEMNVVWADADAAKENKGKTDAMTGTVVFTSAGLTPVSSQKTMDLAARTDKDGKAYNNSYTYTADYEKHTSTVRFGKTADDTYTDTQDLALKTGLQYDNEQLFYLLRAFRNLKEGATVSFPINNVIENYARGTSDLFTLSGTIVRETEKTLGDFIGFAPDLIDGYVAPATSDILCLTLTLNGENHGAAHTFYIADPSLTFGKGNIKTSKLIVGYTYSLFDMDDGAETLRFAYSLSDYTTRQAA